MGIGFRCNIPHDVPYLHRNKKASPVTTVEVANGAILPVDGFGAIEVDLDHPGTTTKPVTITVPYVPGLSSWNLLSTHKAVE